MSKQPLIKRVSAIQDELQRLNNALYAMSTADIQRYPDNYEALSTDAALLAEKVACQLRHLIYTTTLTKPGDYLPSAASAQGIEVREKDGTIEITLPGLLPKRKQRQNAEFLLDPFNAALSHFAAEHPVPRFQHCVVCFCSVYDRTLSERRVRDYDNLELKRLLDVAASYLLTDDTGLLLDTYHTTELGDADCTRIVIMPSTRLSAWLEERQAGLQSITDL